MVLRACTIAAVLGCATSVQADDGGDGIYGRFDGDVTWSAAVGGGVSLFDSVAEATGVIELRGRYLDSAGLWLAPIWIPGDDTVRLGLGVELRPLFPALFLADLSTGVEFVDLVIGSLSLDLGLTTTLRDDQVSPALVVGFGVDLPIVVDQATGLFLHLGAQHAAARASDVGSDADVSAWTTLALLGFRGLLGSAIVAIEPPRYLR